MGYAVSREQGVYVSENLMPADAKVLDPRNFWSKISFLSEYLEKRSDMSVFVCRIPGQETQTSVTNEALADCASLCSMLKSLCYHDTQEKKVREGMEIYKHSLDGYKERLFPYKNGLPADEDTIPMIETMFSLVTLRNEIQYAVNTAFHDAGLNLQISLNNGGLTLERRDHFAPVVKPREDEYQGMSLC